MMWVVGHISGVPKLMIFIKIVIPNGRLARRNLLCAFAEASPSRPRDLPINLRSAGKAICERYPAPLY